MKKILLLFLLLTSFLGAKDYKYDLSVTAIFRNEGPWLKEWIEYHKIVGVQHFYLYNNLSTDNYAEVLAPYVKSGEVELFDWPYQSTSVPHWTKIQTSAYMHALKRAKRSSRWLAMLDLDEFIVPVTTDNIVAFLADYERYGGVCIHWQLFGTSGISKIPPNALMIETLTWKGSDNYGENAFIKSIFHPKDVDIITDPHKAEYKKGKYMVNTRKQRVTNSTNTDFDIEKIRINHYWSRDEDYFFNNKRPRREGWGEGFDGQQQRNQNLNTVQDHFILRFVPELRKRMGFE